MPRALTVATLLSVGLAACGGSTASVADGRGDEESRGAEVHASRRALLEAAGGRAAATVVLHPRHWSVLTSAAIGVAGELLPDELRPILSAGGLWPAARRLASEERVTLPRTLDGWDDGRPILLSLFEPPDLSLTEILARTAEQRPPVVIGHRVVIPAADADALSRSLVSIARALGCQDASPAHAEHFSGASVLRCDDALAVVERGEGLVRIRAAEAPDGASAVPLSLTRPVDEPLIITPALRWAIEGPVVVAAHVRPERLRAAFLVYSAEEPGRMAGYSSGQADHAAYLARAKKRLLGAILRTSPIGAEVDDLAVGLVTGHRPTFALVQGLTEVGRAAYDAGLGATVRAEGPEDAPLVVRSRVDVDAMQAVAGVPMGMGGVADPNAAMSRVGDCGEACAAYMLATRIFGLGALSDQAGLVRAIEEEAGPFFRFEPADLEDDVTMVLRFDCPALARRLGGDRMATEIARGLGVAHAIQARHERTLMTTVRLGEVPPAPDPARYAAGDPGPAASGRARDAGATCAEAAIIGLEAASGDVAGAPTACPDAPDELRLVLEAWSRLR